MRRRGLGTHMILTLVLAWWATALVLTPDRIARTPGYRVMAEVASQPAWMISLGLISIAGMISAWMEQRWAWSASTAAISAAHGALAICVALSDHSTPGIAPYVALAYMGYMHCWRA